MAPRENEDFIVVAEFQVLNLLTKNPTLSDITLSIDSFPHKKARAIYKAILQLSEKGEVINEGSLLRESNVIESTIDHAMVSQILSYTTDESNFKSALSVLQEGSIKYRLGRILTKIQEEVSSPDTLDATFISSKLYEAQESLLNGSRKYSVKTLEDCLTEYEEELLLRQKGIQYPFNDLFLDRMLVRKAAPGQVILLAGATGTGKSAYGLNLICRMIDANIPCMYFSLEMDTISTMDRFVAMQSEIPVMEFYGSGAQLNPLIKQVQDYKELYSNKQYAFIDDPSISLEAIRHLIREFKIQHKVNYVCVYIDLITQVKEFVDLSTSKGTLATTIELAVNRLNAMAKKENICIVAIAQMNRTADSMRIDNIDNIHLLRPTLNHVKNSGALGERSRIVLSVFRPKYYASRFFPEDENLEFMPDELEVQVLKQSMGGVGTICRYNFNGPTFTCRPLSDEGGNLETVQATEISM